MNARTLGRLGLLIFCLELSAIRANADTVHAFAYAHTQSWYDDNYNYSIPDPLSSGDFSSNNGYFAANATSHDDYPQTRVYFPGTVYENILTVGTPQKAEASASSVNLVNSASILHLGVGGLVDGGSASSYAYATSYWNDTYLLGTTLADDPHIDRITFTFSVDGRFRLGPTLLTSAPVNSYASSLKLQLLQVDPTGPWTIQGLGQTGKMLACLDSTRTTLGNSTLYSDSWTRPELWTGGDGYTNFDGTFNLTIKLARNVIGDQVLYAGDWNIAMQLYLQGVNGIAEADFHRTLTLTEVTLSDGSRPEDHGYSSSFASGIRPTSAAAVPEPSSVVMLGLGSIGAIGTASRRRSRS